MKDLPRAPDTLIPAAEPAEIRAKRADLGYRAERPRAEELRPVPLTGAECPRTGQPRYGEAMEQNAQASNDIEARHSAFPAGKPKRPEITKINRKSPDFWCSLKAVLRPVSLDPAGDAIKAAVARWEAQEISHARKALH